MLYPRIRLLHSLWVPVLLTACSTGSEAYPSGLESDELAVVSESGVRALSVTAPELLPQIAQTPSTRGDGRGGFRFDEWNAELFYMPFYAIEADEQDSSGSKTEIDNGQGFGAKIGIGDDDQGIGLLYMASWNDESTTGGTLSSHALYADFHARGLFWRSRSVKGWARFNGGLGMAGIDFSGDYKDQTSGAINLRGAIQLEFNDRWSIDLGLGGFLWGVPGDTLAWGSFMTLGGSVRF